MARRLCLLFLASAFLPSQLLFAAITGRVVDGAGTPVADAMVMYTNLNNRLVYAYTCTDGTFNLVAPTDWNLKSLQMYCGQSGVSGPTSAETVAGSSLALSAEGDMIRFHVSAPQKVTVDLYSMSGRQIQTVFSGDLTKGNYQLNPFSRVKLGVAHQACVVQVRSGRDVESRTLIYTGTRGKIVMAAVDGYSRNDALPKKAAAVDSIRAGKTNFFPAYKPIDNYTMSVGDIAISARDIEAQIDSIMTGKTTSWKAYQVTQGVQYLTTNNWGTVFYGVGNGGPGYVDNANQSDGWQTGTIAAQGTPKMIAIDAVHGFISPPGGTFFPHNIGMGCTGIPNLAELEEHITAIELRAMAINWAFAPDVDVPRNERWGRTYEGWDEGPDGSCLYVKSAVRGFQKTDLSSPYSVAATAKHIAGGGGAANGQNAGNCNTGTPDVLAKIHLADFKVAVDNGLATTMAGMVSWLGVGMHFNKPILTDTLKTAWKFDGFVTGDWQASAGDLLGSFNDGVDNMMNPADPNAAYTAVNVQSARLDDAAKRILRVKLRLNLMADPLAKRQFLPLIKSPAHVAVARECVRRSMVLLKNDPVNGTPVLPLNPAKNYHIIGHHAISMMLQIGGWALNWPTGATDVLPAGTNIRDAIKAACTGTVTQSDNGSNIPATADVVIVVFGEQPYAEGGGDAPTSQPIDYDNDGNANCVAQRAELDAAKASGKPVVGLLITGRPLIITQQIAKCNAFMCAWLPGTEGGGIADILFAVNGEKPTGKLSHTWPASYAQIPINTPGPTGALYGDVVGSGGNPLFPYHYGLTY
jgi:beta-glucosidase